MNELTLFIATLPANQVMITLGSRNKTSGWDNWPGRDVSKKHVESCCWRLVVLGESYLGRETMFKFLSHAAAGRCRLSMSL